MHTNGMTFMVGGEAGQGIESSGAGFALALARGGLQVFGLPGYVSRVRGGNNSCRVRVAEEPVYGNEPAVHLLLAMDAATVELHQDEVVEGGGMIYDAGLQVDEDALRDRGIVPIPVPLVDMAVEAGGQIMANTAALAAAAGVVGYDLEYINGVIRDNFQAKGQQVVNANLEVARKGYAYARERLDGFAYQVRPLDAPRRMVLTGNQALCLGALVGGCRFVAAYPMTPATGIIEWMAAHQERYGIVTKHVEDEIAAICMAIGANHMGVRGMAATSGGGFSLMVEALGLAGMTETPLVIVEAQRPGPATGMPTRTEQADLLFVLHASQGEFPRLVLAPRTVEECFEAGWRAFNLAEKYQTPVIILTDNLLANSVRSVERDELGFERAHIDRGDLLTDDDLDGLEGPYRRYRLT